jgi:hypothetical protein
MIEISTHRDTRGEITPKSVSMKALEARAVLIEKLNNGAKYTSMLPHYLDISGSEEGVWVTTRFEAINGDLDGMRLLHVVHKNHLRGSSNQEAILDLLQTYEITTEGEVAIAMKMDAEDLLAALQLAKEVRSRQAYAECREALRQGIWCGDEEERQLSLFGIALKHGIVETHLPGRAAAASV